MLDYWKRVAGITLFIAAIIAGGAAGIWIVIWLSSIAFYLPIIFVVLAAILLIARIDGKDTEDGMW